MTRSSDAGVVRLRCEQLSPVIADLEHNKQLILDAVARSLDAAAQVIVLPELSTSGYLLESTEEALSVAITIEDELFADIAGLIAAATSNSDAVAIFGFCEVEAGVLYNSAALVGKAGIQGVYRKTHLWDREKLIFTPGDALPLVYPTAHGAVGILICYDLEFPELTRSLALDGADLIAVPTNWPIGEHPAGERAGEMIQAQAAARTNAVFIAICDRTGIERGQTWVEGTSVINQFGWVIATAGPESPVATADVFLALARNKEISSRNDLLGDRRPALYKKLVAND